MLNILKMSEAASMAIHAMVVVAANDGRTLTVKNIASVIKVSETHLSKVMQRLTRAGLVVSTRGPGGGFELNGGNNKLLEIYEAVDGPLATNNCLFEKSICEKKKCIFDKLLNQINRDFHRYMLKTNLKSIVKKNGGKPWKIS